MKAVKFNSTHLYLFDVYLMSIQREANSFKSKSKIMEIPLLTLGIVSIEFL